MKGVNKKIEAYLDEHEYAKKIINEVVAEKGKTFGTHDFILKLLQDSLEIKAGKDTFVQALDSQIGRYLSQKQATLSIKKVKQKPATGIKGTPSTNQEWEKL